MAPATGKQHSASAAHGSTDAGRLELDTYCVLDGRSTLRGSLKLPQDAGRSVKLAVTAHETGHSLWEQTLASLPGMAVLPIELPVHALPGGYYTLTAEDDLGRRCQANLVLREDLAGEAPGPRPVEVVPAGPTAPENQAAGQTAHPCQCTGKTAATTMPTYLAAARTTVDRILAEQTRPLHDQPGETPFVTVGRTTALGYRSLGHKTGDAFVTFWFPEEPFELDTFRADHDLWPVLDHLSRLSGEPHYSALVEGMVAALAEPGFDPHSGLLHFSEESDFDVRQAGPHSKRMASDPPRFKPINGGPRTDMHIERFWQHLPRQTQRWLRATYYGLVTNPETMDFNRFCGYGFDDRARVPAQAPNSGHCGFETAAASLILFWASCWAYAGDAECLEWARRMTRKWGAVQDSTSGLVPNFFGAAAWVPGAAQRPGEWAEARGAAMTAPQWLLAASMLRRRPGAEALADELAERGRRLALGVARHAYDPQRRVFIEHLHLDGQPYTDTARYCFRTQSEKDEAVRRDPQMAQVAVYDGAGFYRQPNYYEQCAGSNIPHSLAQAAALCPDPELVERLRPLLAAAVEEASQLGGAFTPEGRWTFRASGWYIQACVRLFRITGNALHLEQARCLAERELAALQTVRTPHWWRLRERAIWLEALLMLHEAVQTRH